MWEALKAAGIVREGDYVRRVIIDMDVTSAVTIYIERYADTRMLDILPVIGHGRSEIRWADKAQQGPARELGQEAPGLEQETAAEAGQV